MKKIIGVFVVVSFVVMFIVVGSAPAEKPYFSNVITLFSASTATTLGTGGIGDDSTAYSLGHVYKAITCAVTQSSTTTPVNSVFTLKGSLDGTNYATLKTITSTAWPDIQTTNAATAIPVRYILATFTSTSLGGGESYTNQNFTVKCQGSN